MKDNGHKMKDRTAAGRRLEKALFDVERLTDAAVDEELRFLGVDPEEAAAAVLRLIDHPVARVDTAPLRLPIAPNRSPVYQCFRNLTELSARDKAILLQQRRRLLAKALTQKKKKAEADDE